MSLSKLSLLLISFLLMSCVDTTDTVTRGETRILAMGDSMMAAHKISGRAVSHSVSRHLNEPVQDQSVVGASMTYALPISGAMGLNINQQYRSGNWDWVVLNGGGNDLWLGCGCGACEAKMERLISADGTSGKIPLLISKIRHTGAQVLWLGYLRSPGVGSPIESCRDEGDELEARIARLAKRWHGVHFLSNANLVPHGDRSFHGADMIHPSLKASNVIGARVSQYIRSVDPKR